MDLLSGKINRFSRQDIRKVMNSAKGEDCQIRLPECCNDAETTVFAHLSSKSLIGGGTGTKGKPIGSYACFSCHGIIDGRIATDLEKDWVWQKEIEGCIRTTCILMDKGILKVA